MILDDEYAQRIEIRSVSSHTVWESASGILPAVKTRAVREKVAPFATSRSRHATCCDGSNGRPRNRQTEIQSSKPSCDSFAALGERIKNCRESFRLDPMPLFEMSTKIRLVSFREITRISPPSWVNLEASFSKFRGPVEFAHCRRPQYVREQSSAIITR